MVYLEGIHGEALFTGGDQGMRFFTRKLLFRSGGGALRIEMLLFLRASLIKEFLELTHEFIDVLELSIH
jgi:hypothetical protein